MSIESGTKQGEEDGIGGVVTPSHRTGVVVIPCAAAPVSPYSVASALHSRLPREFVC
jgi:hypothetical protein